MRRPLTALAVVVLATACSSSSPTRPARTAPTQVQQSIAPVPGVSLPADALAALVPTPSEVPSGFVPLIMASGVRDLDTVAGYSGTGAAKTAAAASLTAHGFSRAYTVQYADQASGAVVSVVVSEFATPAGATADYLDDIMDIKDTSGAVVPSAVLGEASVVRIRQLTGGSQLVLARFRRGIHTWSLAYEANPSAEPSVAIDLARKLLARTAG